MRRRELMVCEKYGGVETTVAKAVAGDICFYSKKSKEKIIVPYSKWTYDLYPISHYTPIGVVVVPGNHNVYGTGTCAIMSLYDMSPLQPDTGSVDREWIRFGKSGKFYLTEHNVAVIVSETDTGGDEDSTIVGEDTVSGVCLPSNNFPSSYTKCLHDTDTYYDYYPQAPSPYLTNNLRNSAYYSTYSSNNCLSDFNGTGNTNKMISNATSQSGWKTDSTITNNGNSGYAPACCCCWRYHTEGTSQGDWYLPAMGELGYLAPKFKNIQKTLQSIVDYYNIGIILENVDYKSYLSSTYCEREDYSYSRTVSIDFKWFQLGDPYCDNGSGLVRAFLCLS